MSHFSIAGLQLATTIGNNLEAIGKQIRQCKSRFPWVDMLVMSELCSYGPEKKYAEVFPGPAEKFYCELAQSLNVWLIPGSHYEQDGEHIYNTTSVINNLGEVVCRYRKIFPFYPYEEGVSCGGNFVVFDVPQGRIGIAICYDLWFPEVARTLVSQGAEVIIYPTMTGTIDRPIELIMAQATAATNQCYVIAVNTVGTLGNGQSIFAGPDGGSIYVAGNNEEIIPIEIDFALVRRNRERGLHQLGQPLKSFRDNKITFPVYQADQADNALAKLGPLELPTARKAK